MNPAAKLGAFGLLLLVLLGGGAVAGRALGPIDVGSADAHDTHGGHAADATAGALPVGGLLVSQDGYELVPESRDLAAGSFSFRILGPTGEVVQRFAVLHDRELHLVVASRDLREYAHLHPARDAAGRWTVELPDLPPGPYRVFADLQPTGGPHLTLGVDALVAGPATVEPPLAASDHDVVDGLDVTLERTTAGDADAPTSLTVTVRRDGRVVFTEPYLGAAGHLVALRDGDLAYLHVHPLDDEPTGPVRFAVEVPAAGTYALFFDFQVDGVVRTARFVLHAPGPVAPAAPAER